MASTGVWLWLGIILFVAAIAVAIFGKSTSAVFRVLLGLSILSLGLALLTAGVRKYDTLDQDGGKNNIFVLGEPRAIL